MSRQQLQSRICRPLPPHLEAKAACCAPVQAPAGPPGPRRPGLPLVEAQWSDPGPLFSNIPDLNLSTELRSAPLANADSCTVGKGT